VTVRCSIGLGHVRGGLDPSVGTAQLIGDADRRMYANKRRRRG
jgi:hypothetical protein